MLKIMTPGPTQVRENVRAARSTETTNPDLDPVFFDEYKATCDMIGSILHTKNEVYILSGEGILGLEAACVSLTEPGDRILVIDNGEYGAGFADFVSMFGGIPILYSQPYDETIDIDKLASWLTEHHDFKYATVVHHDTPSGMLNDVERIGRLLDQYGIISVVDSVSGMIGEELHVDEGKLDIVCGASQKAVSAPPGLTFLTVSNRAIQAMEKRKTPVCAYYANILNYRNYYEKQWFPYTMPISDIYGLRQALQNILEEPEIAKRHSKLAEAVRRAVTESGLALYGKNGYSSLTTAIRVPDELDVNVILKVMQEEHNIMIAGSFGKFAGKILRIGHMGENANQKDIKEVLEALEQTLCSLGLVSVRGMAESFQHYA